MYTTSLTVQIVTEYDLYNYCLATD